MIVDIKVPSPGESVTEVTIGKILVQNGETVAIDQIICELESDKLPWKLPPKLKALLPFL